MLDRMLGILALLVVCGFLGILLWKVPRLDLAVVIGITVLLAAGDFALRRAPRRRP